MPARLLSPIWVAASHPPPPPPLSALGLATPTYPVGWSQKQPREGQCIGMQAGGLPLLLLVSLSALLLTHPPPRRQWVAPALLYCEQDGERLGAGELPPSPMWCALPRAPAKRCCGLGYTGQGNSSYDGGGSNSIQALAAALATSAQKKMSPGSVPALGGPD